MTEPTMIDFLEARLDEREADQSEPYCSDGWHANHCALHNDVYPREDCDCGVPAFVLADVAAKRRLLAGHGPGRVVDESDGRWASDPDSWDPPWTKCTGHEWAAYPCELLRLLALPFASHPDYRPEWAPEVKP